jgi:hypothetical protein
LKNRALENDDGFFVSVMVPHSLAPSSVVEEGDAQRKLDEEGIGT